MSSKTENMKAVINNPRSRMVMFITVFIVIATIVLGFMLLRSGNKSGLGGNAMVPHAPAVETRPGTSTNPQYSVTVEEANKKAAEQAMATGQSHLPVLNNIGSIPDPPPPGIATPKTPPSIPLPQIQQKPRPTVQSQAVRRQTSAEEARANKNAYAMAEKQVLGYLGLWKAQAGTQEFNYVGDVANTAADEANGFPVSPPTSNPSTPASTSASTSKSSVVVRAGTVIPGLLITPLNSDAPGPVLGDIVSGPLAGGRVIGSYEASENQIVVRFQTLSMPGHAKSYRINAYAVDMSLRAGLATDVNHHYLKRFGTVAAAAFIRGYGEAIARQNSTVTTGPFGSTVSYGALDSSQINRAALGQVGAALGQQISREGQVKSTIKAEGQDGRSLPIGILFLSDF